MLNRPPSCGGCPLNQVASGFMRPALAADPYGVALIGEALGEDEANEGAPFVGRAGFRLTRLIEWAGFDRSRFDIYNAVWCRPPNNQLVGTEYEQTSIDHCKSAHWARLLERSSVLVPMGNVPTRALTGKTGILTLRGYLTSDGGGRHVIPTIHPSFIQRGMAKWSAAFINDLQKAVSLASTGLPPSLLDYRLDPTPMEAYEWARTYRSTLVADPTTRLAFDIETPGKSEDEDDLDTDSDAPDRTWKIDRIGFSYRALGALSIPWEPSYMAAIRLLLSSDGEKVVWNAGFDVPRVRRAGVEIRGLIHDGMVAWHILHSDLPKRLAFVATFTCPLQPAWKHLSGARPAFYNATDADVEWRSMDVIAHELHKCGLWEVYQRDVVDLEPILVHMHDVGMPIDADIRLDRAIKLTEKLAETTKEMEALVPIEARRISHVYKSTPASTEDLLSRPSTRTLPTCTRCGAIKPRKTHFRRTKKVSNPCEAAGTVEREIPITEYYRVAPFTPSGQSLTRYHQWIRRALPTVYDKRTRGRRVSFGEEQLKDLSIRYPDDKLYRLIAEFRETQKIAGTYIGYAEES